MTFIRVNQTVIGLDTIIANFEDSTYMKKFDKQMHFFMDKMIKLVIIERLQSFHSGPPFGFFSIVKYADS